MQGTELPNLKAYQSPSVKKAISKGFELGKKVQVIGTSFVAKIIEYNEDNKGKHPTKDYPIKIKIIDASISELIGSIEFYKLDELELIQ